MMHLMFNWPLVFAKDKQEMMYPQFLGYNKIDQEDPRKSKLFKGAGEQGKLFFVFRIKLI